MTGGEDTGGIVDSKDDGKAPVIALLSKVLLVANLTAPANPYDPIDPYYRKPDVANVT